MTQRFSGLDIEESETHGRRALRLSGELDTASVPVLHRAISRICEGPAEPTSVTLDMSGLMFIDSTGLAEIILTALRCEHDGRELSLIRGPRAVQRLFELTGTIDALPFQQEEAGAAETVDVNAFAEPPVESGRILSMERNEP
jgi:anti-anti-sigma factor